METNLYTSNFNRKRFIWLKLIVFVILLSMIFYQIGQYFEDISNQNQNTTDYIRAWDEFYDIPSNTLDLVFIGSSHAYCSFNPVIVDETLGTNSFNLGSPLQHPDASYHVVKELLRYQRPKTIVFEIYWDMLDDEFDLKQADTVISAIGRQEFESEFIRDVFPLAELAKYMFKPVRYQQDVFNYWNKELREKVEEYIEPIEKKDVSAGVSYYKGRGFIYSDIIIAESEFYQTNQFVGLNGKKWDFHKVQKSYVERLVALCRDEGIEIVFVTAPIANVSLDLIENYQALHDKIAEFSSDLGVVYRDYNVINLEKELFVNENFRDDAHLNNSGVEIFMEDFLDWYDKLVK